ncbi:hypothetical protein MtrunA17_Chr7g0248081 [Medicago truncatula]|uniref:Transmembrane protein n=1 Tax=Medicago truncatula TaxID=3880 RepID=A0A396H7L7_MEDTR|nr:hypothetical protein MtrunA17_Chr7g0248081 [Medicago truncatula]
MLFHIRFCTADFYSNSTTATEFPRASSNIDTNKTPAVLAFSSVGAVGAGAMARNYVARKREMQLNFNNYLKCRLKEHFLMTATKRTMKITAWYLKGFVAISHIFSEQHVRTSFYRVSLALECTIYFVIIFIWFCLIKMVACNHI